MVNQETMKNVAMPQSLRDAVDEFFTFTEESGISYWDRQDWVVERYSKFVDTLFFRPLFIDHDRMVHMDEFRMANDFLRERSGNSRLQVGFFSPRGKNLMTREELWASRQPVEEKSEEKIDYANLKKAVSIESIFSKDEENG